jgi:DNA repair protein RadA/Sms
VRQEEERQTAAAYHREQVRIVRDRMGLGEQTARHPNGADHDQSEDIAELPQISVSSFAAKPPPPREWHVPDLIPASQVTLFGGDGKVGKSKLAMQLCVATAAELEWLGMKPAPGPVIYVGAEDDVDKFHRQFQ